MKRNAPPSVFAASLLALASAANAAEPMPLSDTQMDSVTAGALSSTATSAASVAAGTVFVRASTSTYFSGPYRSTQASALGVALGTGASANASTHSAY